ncbi:MAG: hypothetical protein R3B45_15570 [Bdellovibrionota bacterium]
MMKYFVALIFLISVNISCGELLNKKNKNDEEKESIKFIIDSEKNIFLQANKRITMHSCNPFFVSVYYDVTDGPARGWKINELDGGDNGNSRLGFGNYYLDGEYVRPVYRPIDEGCDTIEAHILEEGEKVEIPYKKDFKIIAYANSTSPAPIPDEKTFEQWFDKNICPTCFDNNKDRSYLHQTEEDMVKLYEKERNGLDANEFYHKSADPSSLLIDMEYTLDDGRVTSLSHVIFFDDQPLDSSISFTSTSDLDSNDDYIKMTLIQVDKEKGLYDIYSRTRRLQDSKIIDSKQQLYAFIECFRENKNIVCINDARPVDGFLFKMSIINNEASNYDVYIEEGGGQIVIADANGQSKGGSTIQSKEFAKGLVFDGHLNQLESFILGLPTKE